MDNSTFFLTYLFTFIFCAGVTVALILLIDKGLKRFFENLSEDSDIANFFVKLTNIILLLGGIGAALKGGYNKSETSNWLTLTWDAAEQIQDSLGKLFLSLMILTITFFILHLIAKRLKK